MSEFDSIQTGKDGPLSFDSSETAHGSLSGKVRTVDGIKFPRPDVHVWVRLHLPPELWDQVASVLEKWVRDTTEPFWLDELDVSDAGWISGSQDLHVL